MLGEFNGFSIITQEVGRNTRLNFFRALAASCVLYNRTEHSRGFSICLTKTIVLVFHYFEAGDKTLPRVLSWQDKGREFKCIED